MKCNTLLKKKSEGCEQGWKLTPATLDEITNSILFRLKQRTLPWRFDIVYLPGKSNHAADATSRHPSLSGSANGLSSNDASGKRGPGLAGSARHIIEHI